VFVDVETGVHTAIRKVRRALRDSPDAPTFLDTVPGKGYRFIALVGVEGPATVTAAPVPERARPEVPPPEALPSKSASSSHALFATIALMLAVLAGLSAWTWHFSAGGRTSPTRASGFRERAPGNLLVPTSTICSAARRLFCLRAQFGRTIRTQVGIRLTVRRSW
jgi:hypothetical protein